MCLHIPHPTILGVVQASLITTLMKGFNTFLLAQEGGLLAIDGENSCEGVLRRAGLDGR